LEVVTPRSGERIENPKRRGLWAQVAGELSLAWTE
jgi:hypothetical protein